MKSLFVIIVMAFVFVNFTAIGSIAGVKNIRPDQLKIERTTYAFFQSAENVASLGDFVYWTAVVKLPVGKRITKLKYYHYGSGGPNTRVSIMRKKMGELPQTVAERLCYDNTGSVISVEDTEIDYPVIKSGYTYYIRARSANFDSKIHGIKIIYQD